MRSSGTRRGRRGAAPERSPATILANLDAEARAVYARLSYAEPAPLDQLIAACGLPAPRLLAAVSRLEMEELAVRLPGDRIGRSRP